ncbi:non-heme iron oxygenase ferredoxin subunit [Hydrogenophaga sp.]|jgi:naphthalene 1,2-dioxygenase system ferredoxin subunit|uniref:non-heme iron oxygenase ferredoxin subunit n=1 Tax=Hydrogenophaga sp. TaxID=1904254 RepID=UPI003F6EF545
MKQSWIQIASADKLTEGSMLEVSCNDRTYCLYRVEGNIYATDAQCTHGNASLSDGFIIGDEVECPFHQGLFHIPTGRATGAPCTEDLRTYPVRVEGDVVSVQVPSTQSTGQ